MDPFVLIFLWIGLSVVSGAIAASKNRSGFGYFVLSLICSPVLGLLLAMGIAKKEKS